MKGLINYDLLGVISRANAEFLPGLQVHYHILSGFQGPWNYTVFFRSVCILLSIMAGKATQVVSVIILQCFGVCSSPSYLNICLLSLILNYFLSDRILSNFRDSRLRTPFVVSSAFLFSGYYFITLVKERKIFSQSISCI